jgi:hypothetical protein
MRTKVKTPADEQRTYDAGGIVEAKGCICQTTVGVAQARGVALLTLVQSGLLIAEYTPSEVKLAVTGY